MKSALILGVVVVVVGMMCGGVYGQSGCTMALVSLSPCINYVSGNSSTPSSSCCSSLSSVVGSQPQCLCSLLKGGSSNLGIAVNQTLALALPAACNVQTPPVSRCDAVNGPTSAPAPAASPSGSPDDDAPSSDSVPDNNVPSAAAGNAGSKTVPTRTDGSANSGSSVGVSAFSVFVLMASSMLPFSSGCHTFY